MITIRRGHERGHFDHGWLDTWHTFSFGDYYDPEQMGFSVLRVINDDRVAAGAGFPMHPHRNMEIITYVLEGSLAHKDSLGNGAVIGPGEIQHMTAGRGITHSEFNPSSTDTVHLLQIWIEPNRSGLEPGYRQKAFPLEERRGRLRLVASSDGRDGSLTIHQDTSIYDVLLQADDSVVHAIEPGRRAYLHVARGDLTLNDVPLHEGDGARIEGEREIRLGASGGGEALLFDLP